MRQYGVGETTIARAQNAWSLFDKAECNPRNCPIKNGTIQPLILAVCERSHWRASVLARRHRSSSESSSYDEVGIECV